MIRKIIVVLGLSLTAVSISACTAPVDPAAVPAGSDLPRTPSGRPDLNGIWQAMGNAHWDIEPHMARAALATIPGPAGPVPATEVLALGAVGAVPSGMGIVEGGIIPYLPEALEKRNENRANWLERDPEIRCYLPGIPRATYMQFPFQIFQSDAKFMITFTSTRVPFAISITKIPVRHRSIPGWDSRSASWEGRYFRRGSDRKLHRRHLV